ncbi:MAG: hypothetical protein H6659_10635 [Ardenticatenaceae bacterium]|nr:hypothetical protein [Ardenticatenaceae bacterium]
MKKNWTLIVTLTVTLLLLAAGVARAGGWAVLTLEEMPDHVTAGEPFVIGFAIRQHGKTPTTGLQPQITAVDPQSNKPVKFTAQETADPGHYTATLLLPHTGDWSWEIDGFGSHPLPPLTVQAPPVTAPRLPANAALGLLLLTVTAVVGTAVALIAWTRQRTNRRLGLAAGLFAVGLMGLAGWLWASSPVSAQSEPTAVFASMPPGAALFVAKGCITCHQHSGVSFSAGLSLSIGPDLSRYKGSPDYLRLWLHDPASVKPETVMPNLGLSSDEIETLIQFLTAPE